MFVTLIFLVVVVIFIFLNLRSKKISRESSPKIRKISEVQNSSYQGQLKARDKDISTKTINKTNSFISTIANELTGDLLNNERVKYLELDVQVQENLKPTIRLVPIKEVLFKKFLLLVLLFILTPPSIYQLF